MLRLPELLAELKSGALRVPPFQRDFEWTGAQRLLLLDSIRSGLPTGSLLVWRTSMTLTAEPVLGPFQLKLPAEASTNHQYLLDGRQRMTTLFAALGAGLWSSAEERIPTTSANAPDESPWASGFDLNSGEFEHLDVPGDEDADEDPDRRVMPLAILLDDLAYDDWRAKKNLTQKQARVARDLRSAFVDYLIPVVPLATDSLEVVTRTFKRVNSAGTEMGELHMARALAWSEGFDLIAEIDTIKEQLAEVGWREIDSELVLKVVAVAAGLEPYRFDVEKLADKLKEVGASGREHLLATVVWALNFVIKVFKRLKMLGPSLLPSMYALVVPAAAAIHAYQANVLITLDDAKRLTTDVLRPWLAERVLADRFGNTQPHRLRVMQRDLEARLGVPGTTPSRQRTKLKPQECLKFNLTWARSRVVATVLAHQQPRGSNGEPLDAARMLADRGTDVIAQLILADAPGIQPAESAKIRARPNLALALLHPANRVIAAPEDLPSLRRLLLYGNPSPEILNSHLIEVAAWNELKIGNYAAFFERRREAIMRAEDAWALAMGADLAAVAKGTKLYP